jgi:signal transduction histidine kinase
MTIFTNLIENSIFWLKHSDIENKEIKIEVEIDNQLLSIIYSDTGPGFNGDNLELMFEPGYSTKPSGTGLGLALCGEAAHRSNGEIRAIKNNQGAEFLITFNQGMVTNETA